MRLWLTQKLEFWNALLCRIVSYTWVSLPPNWNQIWGSYNDLEIWLACHSTCGVHCRCPHLMTHHSHTSMSLVTELAAKQPRPYWQSRDMFWETHSTVCKKPSPKVIMGFTAQNTAWQKGSHIFAWYHWRVCTHAWHFYFSRHGCLL